MGTVQRFSSRTCSNNSERRSQDQGRLDLLGKADEVYVVPCLSVEFNTLYHSGQRAKRTGVTEVKMHGWLPSSSS